MYSTSFPASIHSSAAISKPVCLRYMRELVARYLGVSSPSHYYHYIFIDTVALHLNCILLKKNYFKLSRLILGIPGKKKRIPLNA